MFSRFARFLAVAFTAAAIPTSTAVAMPADPVFTGSATTATGSVTKATVVRSDAAQRQATPSTTAPDRSDAAQISKADLVVLHGRPVAPSHTAPSHVTAPSDGFDWSLAGMTALIALAVAGAAVALRPRRVAT